MRFFFYGTLLDRDVATMVLGRRLPPHAYAPAALPGHARRWVKGASYPIVVLQADDRRFGLIVDGVSDSAEIVVKPLGVSLKGVDTFAGATILGDGRVA